MEKKDSEKKYKKMVIDDVKEYEYSVPLKTKNDRKKLITRVEKMIRSSPEYRDYIQYLKEFVDMNACAFFKNITNEGAENKRIKIEIHHEPFTLYDYVDTVLTKFIDTGTPINECYIADEVMKIHYENKVGLIPLSRTMHQVVHKSNKIKIPLYLLFGDYSKFIEEYSEYVSDELMEKLERKINETKAINANSFDSIDTQYTYLEVDGIVLPRKIEEEKEKEETKAA